MVAPVNAVFPVLSETATVSANTQYVFSFYAKKGTASNVTCGIYDNTNGVNIVNPISYVSLLSDTTLARISLAFTTPANCTSVSVFPVWYGTEPGAVIVYGMQLEVATITPSFPILLTESGDTLIAEDGPILTGQLVEDIATPYQLTLGTSLAAQGYTPQATNYSLVNKVKAIDILKSSEIVLPIAKLRSVGSLRSYNKSTSTLVISKLRNSSIAKDTPSAKFNNTSSMVNKLITPANKFQLIALTTSNVVYPTPFQNSPNAGDFKFGIIGQSPRSTNTSTSSLLQWYLEYGSQSDILTNATSTTTNLTIKTFYFTKSATTPFAVGSSIKVSNTNGSAYTATVIATDFSSVTIAMPAVEFPSIGTFIESSATVYSQLLVAPTNRSSGLARDRLYYNNMSPGIKGYLSGRSNIGVQTSLTTSTGQLSKAFEIVKTVGNNVRLGQLQKSIEVIRQVSTTTFTVSKVKASVVARAIPSILSSTLGIPIIKKYSPPTVPFFNFNISTRVAKVSASAVLRADTSKLRVGKLNTVNVLKGIRSTTSTPIVSKFKTISGIVASINTTVLSPTPFQNTPNPGDFKMFVVGQSPDATTTSTSSLLQWYLEYSANSDVLAISTATYTTSSVKTFYFGPTGYNPYSVGSIIKIGNIYGSSYTATVVSSSIGSVTIAMPRLALPSVGTYVETSATVYSQFLVAPTSRRSTGLARENLYFTNLAPRLTFFTRDTIAAVALASNTGQLTKAIEVIKDLTNNVRTGQLQKSIEVIRQVNTATFKIANVKAGIIARGDRTRIVASQVEKQKVPATNVGMFRLPPSIAKVSATAVLRADTSKLTTNKLNTINTLKGVTSIIRTSVIEKIKRPIEGLIFSITANNLVFPTPFQNTPNPGDFRMFVTGQSADIATTSTASLVQWYLEYGASSDVLTVTTSTYSTSSTKTFYFAPTAYNPYSVGSSIKVANVYGTSYTATVIASSISSVTISKPSVELPSVGTYIETSATVYSQLLVAPTNRSSGLARDRLYYNNMSPGIQGYLAGRSTVGVQTALTTSTGQLSKAFEIVKEARTTIRVSQLQKPFEIVKGTLTRTDVAKLNAAAIVRGDRTRILAEQVEKQKVPATNVGLFRLPPSIAKVSATAVLRADTSKLRVDKLNTANVLRTVLSIIRVDVIEKIKRPIEGPTFSLAPNILFPTPFQNTPNPGDFKTFITGQSQDTRTASTSSLVQWYLEYGSTSDVLTISSATYTTSSIKTFYFSEFGYNPYSVGSSIKVGNIYGSSYTATVVASGIRSVTIKTPPVDLPSVGTFIESSATVYSQLLVAPTNKSSGLARDRLYYNNMSPGIKGYLGGRSNIAQVSLSTSTGQLNKAFEIIKDARTTLTYSQLQKPIEIVRSDKIVFTVNKVAATNVVKGINAATTSTPVISKFKVPSVGNFTISTGTALAPKLTAVSIVREARSISTVTNRLESTINTTTFIYAQASVITKTAPKTAREALYYFYLAPDYRADHYQRLTNYPTVGVFNTQVQSGRVNAVNVLKGVTNNIRVNKVTAISVIRDTTANPQNPGTLERRILLEANRIAFFYTAASTGTSDISRLEQFDVGNYPGDFKLQIVGQNADYNNNLISWYLNDNDVLTPAVKSTSTTRTIYFNQALYTPFSVGSRIKVTSSGSNSILYYATVTSVTSNSVSFVKPNIDISISNTYIEGGSSIYPRSFVSPTTAPKNARENLYFFEMAPALRDANKYQNTVVNRQTADVNNISTVTNRLESTINTSTFIYEQSLVNPAYPTFPQSPREVLYYFNLAPSLRADYWQHLTDRFTIGPAQQRLEQGLLNPLKVGKDSIQDFRLAPSQGNLQKAFEKVNGVNEVPLFYVFQTFKLPKDSIQNFALSPLVNLVETLKVNKDAVQLFYAENTGKLQRALEIVKEASTNLQASQLQKPFEIVKDVFNIFKLPYAYVERLKTGDGKAGQSGVQDPTFRKKAPIQFWN